MYRRRCCSVRLQDLLRYRAESGSTKHLILYGLGNTSSTPTEVSYSALYAQAKYSANIVRSLDGFAKGRPVLLHLEDHWDTIIWFWAVLLADGLPVLSSPFSNVDEHRHKHIEGLSTLLESPICITRAKSLHLFGGSHTLRIQTVESLAETKPNGATPAAAREHGISAGQSTNDGLAMLMLTSGSTGNAKAVRLTHKQVLAACAGKASVRPNPAKLPFLNWIGLDHVASLVEIHLQGLYVGVDQIHVHAADIVPSPLTFLDLLSRHNVFRSFAPNFFLGKLVPSMQAAPADATWDLSSLGVIASGGEANDVSTTVAAAALLQKYGAPRNVITTGFGMTETCAGAIFNLNCPDYDTQQELGVASLGKCMKGIEMRVTIRGEGIKLAATNQPGDLEVRGEVVFAGYYKNPGATKEAFTADGWFRTGDQALLDAAGNLSMIGRTKDILNINGVKFVAADVQASIEQALATRVARCVSFPSKAAHTEQVTVAYVPLNWPLSAEEMAEIDDLAIQASIVSTSTRPLVFSLQEKSQPLLPVSALGKISRAKMRALFEQGVFDEDVQVHRQNVEAYKQELKAKGLLVEATEDEQAVINDIAWTKDIPADTIGVETIVFDLGFTSMDVIKLKNRIDQRLGITVPVIVLMKNPTAKGIAKAIRPKDAAGESSEPAEVNADYDPVVTFRSGGSKTPLWLVHPGVGEVLVFVGLSKYLADNDRPVYALRARGFEENQTRFASIEETVQTYVAAIRKRQPHGPYALAGYSYGTMIAFEISKVLDAQDGFGTVKFLGSFNLPPHIKSRMKQLNWNMCLLHLGYFLGLTTEQYADSIDEASYRDITRDKAMAQILGIADEQRMLELGLGEEGLYRWVEVAFGLQSMAVEYEPSGAVAQMDVFHAIPLKVAAKSRQEWVEVHLSKWNDFCKSEVRFHEVQGAHYTMIGPDYVESFANTLKAVLKARDV
ncbi:hypothetical protein B0T17DRAFT_642186 [Bombardia bombarda]|uniref:Carrier domain-containing protein n=1 Tax=Bombardia bombarda TaxID=252184 RepID=A0AA39WUJ6_9PEZI|nr:hypothetical protein B0T17DRAFT_642186 [Bombardia bombarda]